MRPPYWRRTNTWRHCGASSNASSSRIFPNCGDVRSGWRPLNVATSLACASCRRCTSPPFSVPSSTRSVVRHHRRLLSSSKHRRHPRPIPRHRHHHHTLPHHRPLLPHRPLRPGVRLRRCSPPRWSVRFAAAPKIRGGGGEAAARPVGGRGAGAKSLSCLPRGRAQT
jgi:hypothetical protein